MSGSDKRVLVVGAASRDLDPTDRRGWRLGGTVTYASLVIARLGLPVRALIGVDAEAAGARELGLLIAAGVEVELARLARGPVFDNQQTARGRQQVAHSASDPIRLRELPRTWRAPTAVVLGPVAAELGPAWASVFPPTTTVALGWQGLLRRITAGQPVAHLPLRPLALTRRADIAVVSAEDVSRGRAGIPLAALLPRTGQQLAVTHGRRPLLHLRRGADGQLRARLAAIPPVNAVRDTTGAGDVLLAAWCAGMAASRAAGIEPAPWRLLKLAVAAAGAKVEAASLTDVPDVANLCRRLVTPPSARTG